MSSINAVNVPPPTTSRPTPGLHLTVAKATRVVGGGRALAEPSRILTQRRSPPAWVKIPTGSAEFDGATSLGTGTPPEVTPVSGVTVVSPILPSSRHLTVPADLGVLQHQNVVQSH